MSQLEGVQAAMERMCAEAVDGLLARHRWQLLDRAEFARRTLGHMRGDDASDKKRAAQRAATHTYSLALHAACSGGEGIERQNRAYTELFRYLYDIALQRYPGPHEEIAQQALTRIYTTFERCRQPGAFLAFAIQQLLDTARSLRREQLPAQSLAAPGGEGVPGELLADERQADPPETIIAQELRSRFAELAAQFLSKHPRAARQFAALRLKFIDGLDDQTIAEQLGNSVRNIYVLRARAIEKLRAEPDWRALAIEFGILPDDQPPTDDRRRPTNGDRPMTTDN
jgi:RNA polymerase sigma factor (sigma-70 family)